MLGSHGGTESKRNCANSTITSNLGFAPLLKYDNRNPFTLDPKTL